MTRLAALTALLTLAACTAPQRPVSFTIVTAEDPVATVARALATEGLPPATVEPQMGLLQTRWEDTGFMYGQVQGLTATVVRRYSVLVTPAERGAKVQVRMEAKKCQQGGFSIGETDVRGPCEVLDGLVETHQQELDALGRKLAAALTPARG